jgi:hypothetical protein
LLVKEVCAPAGTEGMAQRGELAASGRAHNVESAFSVDLHGRFRGLGNAPWNKRISRLLMCLLVPLPPFETCAAISMLA